MSTIIYLEENGENQVITEITNIAHMGIEGDTNAKQLSKYIRQGLTLLSSAGLPQNRQLMMIGEEENGDKRTFNLLKPLVSSCPLFEFRVNRSTPGAFRAIFFEFEWEGKQLLVFTRALLKEGDINPPELQTAIKESERLYSDFCNNPSKYLREDD